MRRAILLLLIALFVAACQGESPTDPIENRGPRGRLSGAMTIGPICPPPANCPTGSSDYALRKVLIYNEARTTLLFTVDVASTGFYLIDLPVGRYLLELRGLPNDTTRDLPRTVDILANQVTSVDISVDTGIR